ncbi:MAG: hypothetical protein U0J62_02745 [Lachnospiraceae bacterium]|nr:hypothetical protein [Lachnospiraceae bacterium]
MTGKWKCVCGWLLCICLLIGTIPTATVNAQETAVADYVTVQDETSFMRALAQGKNILVDGRITIGSEVESNGQMRPVQIPGGTVITGNGTGSITSRSPIQIVGDDVRISDIELVFSSSNSLNSVPHREIFLAGHSLTLDNVSTYLEGAAGSLGGLGGTEKELLPSVYAGAYYDTFCGNMARLTIEHANKMTVFQKIELSHDAVNGQRTGYNGEAWFQSDAAVKIREGIAAQSNGLVNISFIGDGSDELSLSYVKGNINTKMSLQGCTLFCDQVESVSQIVLEENGCLQPGSQTQQLENVTIKKGGCLDLSSISGAKIAGSFTGGSNEAYGILVLSPNGGLQIDGQIQGVTQFQTGNRVISGALYDKHTYIRSAYGKAGNFILSQKDINNKYSLIHKDGGWTVYRNYVESVREVDDLEVISCPEQVNMNEMTDPQATALKLIWKDSQGKRYETDEVEQEQLYDAMVAIRSSYWQSNQAEDQKQTDWICPIHLESDEEAPDTYYLVSHGEMKAGEYTLLFFKEPLEEELVTVADVKAQKSNILKEVMVRFVQESEQPVIPTKKPEQTTKPTKEPEQTASPTQSSEASSKPSVTPAVSNKPSATPEATETPVVTEAPEATETPVVTETPEKPNATIIPTVKPEQPADPTQEPEQTISPTQTPLKSNVPGPKPTATVKAAVTSKHKQKGTFFTKARVRKKVLWIYWKKPAKKPAGYQIIYAANAKMNKKKTITIKKGTIVSRKLTVKKKGKKYYFKIRTYQKVSIGKKKRTVYSDWSKVYIVNT